MRFLFPATLACGLLTSLNLRAATTNPPALPIFATGQSTLSDAEAAGAEASAKAMAALGGEPAKLVVVFCGHDFYGPALVDGVASVFGKKLIYGGEVHAPITREGSFAEQGKEVKNSVAVLAIGGNCTVNAAASEVITVASVPKTSSQADKDAQIAARTKVYHDCGLSIGGKLKAAYDGPDSGKLVVTFGSQHVGPNQPFTEGMIEALGSDLKMVGGATGGEKSQQIVAGELTKSANVAILITGDFSVLTASSREDPLKAAGEVCKTLVPDGKTKPAVIFFFEDHVRRNALIKANTLVQETTVIAENSAGATIFGMHDSGEIGHDTPASLPAGGAMRTVAAAIIPR